MKKLFLDIETAPALAYIWDLKTRYVPLSQVAEDGYVLCFAAAWDGSDEYEFWSEWDDGEKAMVKRAWELLDQADAVIHYNGKRFDIPRLQAEFLKYRMGPPMPAHQIDLFATVRAQFKVLSKSMNYMLKLLDIDTKLEHKGMDLWTGCMNGVKDDQRVMEEYNIQDILVLEDLYRELTPWITSHPNYGLYLDSDRPTCRNCGSTSVQKAGVQTNATLSYQRYRCLDCRKPLRGRTRLAPAQPGVLI